MLQLRPPHSGYTQVLNLSWLPDDSTEKQPSKCTYRPPASDLLSGVAGFSETETPAYDHCLVRLIPALPFRPQRDVPKVSTNTSVWHSDHGSMRKEPSPPVQGSQVPLKEQPVPLVLEKLEGKISKEQTG